MGSSASIASSTVPFPTELSSESADSTSVSSVCGTVCPKQLEDRNFRNVIMKPLVTVWCGGGGGVRVAVVDVVVIVVVWSGKSRSDYSLLVTGGFS